MLDDPKGALDRWKQVVREESLVLVDDSAEQLNADWRARVMAYDIVDPCPETTSTARKEVRI